MKIHQNFTSFQPVTITLESKDELALFIRLIGAVTDNIAEEFNLNTKNLYERYEELEVILGNHKYPVLDVAVCIDEVPKQESKDTEVDWSEVPVGTPIEVRDHPSDDWLTVEFNQYIPDMHFPFESSTGILWKYARLIKE